MSFQMHLLKMLFVVFFTDTTDRTTENKNYLHGRPPRVASHLRCCRWPSKHIACRRSSLVSAFLILWRARIRRRLEGEPRRRWRGRTTSDGSSGRSSQCSGTRHCSCFRRRTLPLRTPLRRRRSLQPLCSPLPEFCPSHAPRSLPALGAKGRYQDFRRRAPGPSPKRR